MNIHLPQHRAFTIIELIVAVAIMSLLMFLVNQLFNSTSRAVSTGMKTGELLVESETIGEQLQRDAENMLGPNEEAAAGEPDAEDKPAGFLVIVNRAIPDAMINRRGKELHEETEFDWPYIRSDILMFVTTAGETPADEELFRSITPQNGDGFSSQLRSQYARVWYGHALRTQPDGDFGDPLGEEMNRVANYWTLGRQQLLLAPTGLDTDNDTHAVSADWGATVQHTGGSDPFLFRGFTDVTKEPLTGDPDAEPIDSSIIYSLNDGTYPGDVRPLYMTGSGLEPLHVNPAPDTMNFEPWQMAQMHGQLAGNVSDFIIDVAGDFDATTPGEIDRYEASHPLAGDIIWYTAEAFVNDREDNANFDPARPPTLELPDPPSGSAPHVFYKDSLGSNVTPFVWRHDDEDSANPAASKWPYLIRIRYRMHDGRGDVAHSVDGIEGGLAGRWFEHIIKVNRPRPE